MARRERPAPASDTHASAFTTASPSRPPAVTLYAQREDGARQIVAFGALWAARRYIDLAGPHKWLTSHAIMTASGIRISCCTADPPPRDEPSMLEDIMELELNATQCDAPIPEPHATTWQRFLQPQDTPDAADQVVPLRRTPPPAPSERRTQSRPASTRVSKAIAPGHTTIGDIAASLGIEASSARAALRKAAYPKPEGGWHFPTSDVSRVTATIKEHMK